MKCRGCSDEGGDMCEECKEIDVLSRGLHGVVRPYPGELRRAIITTEDQTTQRILRFALYDVLQIHRRGRRQTNQQGIVDLRGGRIKVEKP